MIYRRFLTSRHFVVDAETACTKPTAALLSLSLSMIDNFNQAVSLKTWVVSAKGQAKRSLDMETVLWWLQQPKAAQDTFASEEARRGAVHIYEVLTDLCDLIKQNLHGAPDYCIWAKPQHFDISLLQSLFQEFAPNAGEQLLHRRRVHNARTLYEAASCIIGEEIDEAPDANFVKHDPAWDAMLTAQTIARCLSILRQASKAWEKL